MDSQDSNDHLQSVYGRQAPSEGNALPAGAGLPAYPQGYATYPNGPGYAGYPGYAPALPPPRRGAALAIASVLVCAVIVCLVVAIVGAVALRGPGIVTDRHVVNSHTQAICNLATHHCDKAPIMSINVHTAYIATIHTVRGDIVMRLDAKDAPLATNNFVFLAQSHFYDGLYFWRVEALGKISPLNNQSSTLQLIQGGSAAADGQDPASIPGYQFNDDPVVGDYTAGVLAMANAGPNTNGCQFFINTGDNSSQLSKNYAIFGKVISGLDVTKKIQPADKMLSVTIQTQ